MTESPGRARLRLALGFILLVLIDGCVPDAYPLPMEDAGPDASAASLPACRRGLHVGIAGAPLATSIDRDASAAAVAEMRLRSVRLRAAWPEQEREAGLFDWRELDAEVGWARSHSLSITLEIGRDAPQWACTTEADPELCHVQAADFAPYVDALLARYARDLTTLTIGPLDVEHAPLGGYREEAVALYGVAFAAARSSAEHVPLGLGTDAFLLRALSVCAGRVPSAGFHSVRYPVDRDVIDVENLTASCERLRAPLEDARYILARAPYDVLDLEVLADAAQWPAYAVELRASAGEDQPIGFALFGGPDVTSEPTASAYQAERMAAYVKTLDEMGVEVAHFERLRQPEDVTPWSGSYLVDASGVRLAGGTLRAFDEVPDCAD